jgi:hypothetical protein
MPAGYPGIHFVTLHPATLLLAWGGLVVVLQRLATPGLGIAALMLLPLSILGARQRTASLIRRARWLLLSIAVMFALATPGERLPGPWGDAGITFDGLLFAAEHVLRLILLLATLALLHEKLGNAGLISGLYWLLSPLAGWRELRERIVVRLMLVLDYVEATPSAGWRGWLLQDVPGPDNLTLAVARPGWPDWLLLTPLACVVLVVWWWL